MTRRKEGVMPRVSKSGRQDISITEYGKFRVAVCGEYIGTFPAVELAVKARDDYRKANNLPAAKY